MGYLKNGVKGRIVVAATCAALGLGTAGLIGLGNSNEIKTESPDSSSAVTTAVTQQSTVYTSAEYTVTNYKNGADNKSELGGKLGSETKSETTTTTTTTKTSSESTSASTTKASVTTTSAAATTTSKAATTTAATTKKKATTSKKIKGDPAVYDVGGSVKERLNSVKPEDMKKKVTVTGSEKAILEKYMKALVNDKMTNYEKVLTCYDYLIKNTRYAYGGWNAPMKSVLVNGFGTCTEYSHVMCAMLRYMGFQANTVWGKTAMAAGGYGEHMWVELYINGNTYVVDPQVDDNISSSIGSISHRRFVKLYSETPGNYIRGYTEKW